MHALLLLHGLWDCYSIPFFDVSLGCKHRRVGAKFLKQLWHREFRAAEKNIVARAGGAAAPTPPEAVFDDVGDGDGGSCSQ